MPSDVRTEVRGVSCQFPYLGPRASTQSASHVSVPTVVASSRLGMFHRWAVIGAVLVFCGIVASLNLSTGMHAIASPPRPLSASPPTVTTTDETQAFLFSPSGHSSGADELGGGSRIPTLHREAASSVAATDVMPVGDGQDESLASFSFVMLSYKAPKSLTATIESLGRSGLLCHPSLRALIVYFQVFDRTSDSKLVHRAVADALSAAAVAANAGRRLSSHHSERHDGEGHGASLAPCNESAERVRVEVMGAPDNLPVAKATFAALKAVRTPAVLYVECDRPILPTIAPSEVRQAVDTALRYVSSGTADVFRLQLYASPMLQPANRGGGHPVKVDAALPLATYGAGPYYDRCLAAPRLSEDACRSAKSRSHVDYTAYCKHWKKFIRDLGSHQQDLCDSFCFMSWITSPQGRTVVDAANKSGTGNGKFTDLLVHEHDKVVCLSSADCNWTNQPTMYLLSWYQANVKRPCEEAKVADCVGKPGRRSAVLQEHFFVKNVTAWASKRHKVCLHQTGLFFHNEVDNRE